LPRRVNYWLLKSEPDVFGIRHLARLPRKTGHWDGVRNYQARNFLRDAMKKGDLGFFYHSSCAEPAIAGIVEIARAGYPDHTALDPESPHYDPKSTPDNPIWYMVDVKLKRAFRHPIPLAALKCNPALKGMKLLQRGNRLSILPVTSKEWSTILKMETTD
jgi:predicted RNA-binding protein with PUA-like domain